jgi:hypothetical protein
LARDERAVRRQRPSAHLHQVLIDREVALSKAWLLCEKAHQVLDDTWQDQLEAAAARRARHRGRGHAGGPAHARARPAAAQDHEDQAADRDQREIERNMVQPPDEPTE